MGKIQTTKRTQKKQYSTSPDRQVDRQFTSGINATFITGAVSHSLTCGCLRWRGCVVPQNAEENELRMIVYSRSFQHDPNGKATRRPETMVAHMPRLLLLALFLQKCFMILSMTTLNQSVFSCGCCSPLLFLPATILKLLL